MKLEQDLAEIARQERQQQAAQLAQQQTIMV